MQEVQRLVLESRCDLQTSKMLSGEVHDAVEQHMQDSHECHCSSRDTSSLFQAMLTANKTSQHNLYAAKDRNGRCRRTRRDKSQVCHIAREMLRNHVGDCRLEMLGDCNAAHSVATAQ